MTARFKIPQRENLLIVRYSNILLLILVAFTVFIIPLLPLELHKRLFSILYSLIFFASVTSLKSKRKLMVYIAIFAFATEWVAELNDASVLMFISRLANVVFFFVVVIKLIIQIASYRDVDLVVIIEAVTGYLLMGLMFSICIILILTAEPGAFSFYGGGDWHMVDVNYFTFVTQTTLGYGDFLPIMPVSKSLALLITISGQLYLTIIVATLVGKFLSQTSASEAD